MTQHAVSYSNHVVDGKRLWHARCSCGWRSQKHDNWEQADDDGYNHIFAMIPPYERNR